MYSCFNCFLNLFLRSLQKSQLKQIEEPWKFGTDDSYGAPIKVVSPILTDGFFLWGFGQRLDIVPPGVSSKVWVLLDTKTEEEFEELLHTEGDL